MTPLIWILIWLLRALSGTCALPDPVNVNLSSNHFIHLLTWAPGLGTPPGVHYRVMIKDFRSGLPWKEVAGCEHVQSPLVCNLTKDFSEIDNIYYYQVYAVLGNQSSNSIGNPKGFLPIDNTYLDPPKVTVRACNGTLCVDLRPPIGSLEDIYNKFTYALIITSKGRAYTMHTKSLKGEVLKDLAPGRQYCVSVQILGNEERTAKNSSYSQPHCASTSANPTAGTIDVLVAVCAAVVLMFLCVSLLFHTGYICLKPPLPDVLISIKHQEHHLPEPDCKERFSPVQVLPPSGCDDSEVETEAEGTSCSGEAEYETRRGTEAALTSRDSLSSSASSSGPNKSYHTSSSADLPSPGETLSICPLSPLSLSDNRLPDLDRGRSQALDPRSSLSSERSAGMVEGLLPMEEEEEGCLEISLLSVTLGGREEVRPLVDVAGPEPQGASVRDSPDPTTPFLPSVVEFWAPEPVSTQTHVSTADMEEESQCYLRR
uniref:Fibronectin type-III domain-containing protein n=1 Tax=Esox lucius TaxID=8010 RepID=A0A3P9A5F8_ESOLU